MNAVMRVAKGMWEYVTSSIHSDRGKIGVFITGRSIDPPSSQEPEKLRNKVMNWF